MSKDDEGRLWYLNRLEQAYRIPKDVVMLGNILARVQYQWSEEVYHSSSSQHISEMSFKVWDFLLRMITERGNREAGIVQTLPDLVDMRFGCLLSSSSILDHRR
jgi:hypothetical protein